MVFLCIMLLTVSSIVHSMDETLKKSHDISINSRLLNNSHNFDSTQPSFERAPKKNKTVTITFKSPAKSTQHSLILENNFKKPIPRTSSITFSERRQAPEENKKPWTKTTLEKINSYAFIYPKNFYKEQRPIIDEEGKTVGFLPIHYKTIIDYALEKKGILVEYKELDTHLKMAKQAMYTLEIDEKEINSILSATKMYYATENTQTTDIIALLKEQGFTFNSQEAKKLKLDNPTDNILETFWCQPENKDDLYAYLNPRKHAQIKQAINSFIKDSKSSSELSIVELVNEKNATIRTYISYLLPCTQQKMFGPAQHLIELNKDNLAAIMMAKTLLKDRIKEEDPSCDLYKESKFLMHHIKKNYTSSLKMTKEALTLSLKTTSPESYQTYAQNYIQEIDTMLPNTLAKQTTRIKEWEERSSLITLNHEEIIEQINRERSIFLKNIKELSSLTSSKKTVELLIMNDKYLTNMSKALPIFNKPITTDSKPQSSQPSYTRNTISLGSNYISALKKTAIILSLLLHPNNKRFKEEEAVYKQYVENYSKKINTIVSRYTKMIAHKTTNN